MGREEEARPGSLRGRLRSQRSEGQRSGGLQGGTRGRARPRTEMGSVGHAQVDEIERGPLDSVPGLRAKSERRLRVPLHDHGRTKSGEVAREGGRQVSMRTALHCGMEVLQGIRELHEAGYLHRDVKPENFAIGRPPDTRRVFVLDLGTVREWRSAKGVLWRSTGEVPFWGNTKYASSSALAQNEQARCDDLWAWYYKLIDLTTGSLPWPPLPDGDIYAKVEATAKARDKLNRDPGKMIRTGPKEYGEIQSYLCTLRYESEPDYEFIHNILKGIFGRRCQESDPLDWEEGGDFHEQTQMVPSDARG